jgi:hypothetical protein
LSIRQIKPFYYFPIVKYQVLLYNNEYMALSERIQLAQKLFTDSTGIPIDQLGRPTGKCATLVNAFLSLKPLPDDYLSQNRLVDKTLRQQGLKRMKLNHYEDFPPYEVVRMVLWELGAPMATLAGPVYLEGRRTTDSHIAVAAAGDNDVIEAIDTLSPYGHEPLTSDYLAMRFVQPIFYIAPIIPDPGYLLEPKDYFPNSDLFLTEF